MQQYSYINSVNLKNETSFPYLVLDANSQKSNPEPPGFHVMHWHNDFQFLYVLQGEICFNTLNETKTISIGEGVFINKNVVHQIKPMSGCHYKSFIFPQHLIEFYPGSPARKYVKLVADSRQFSTFHFTKDIMWCRNALSIMRKLADLEQETSIAYEYEVLVLLVQLWLEMIKNIEITDSITENEVTLRMQIFLQYIEQHYFEDISLEELAKSANVSKSECLRCFKSTMNTTPYKYLIEYRLSQAISLLNETDLQIGVIGEQVGFHQASHFGKCFREKTGYSPREYRKI